MPVDLEERIVAATPRPARQPDFEHLVAVGVRQRRTRRFVALAAAAVVLLGAGVGAWALTGRTVAPPVVGDPPAVTDEGGPTTGDEAPSGTEGWISVEPGGLGVIDEQTLKDMPTLDEPARTHPWPESVEPFADRFDRPRFEAAVGVSGALLTGNSSGLVLIDGADVRPVDSPLTEVVSVAHVPHGGWIATGRDRQDRWAVTSVTEDGTVRDTRTVEVPGTPPQLVTADGTVWIVSDAAAQPEVTDLRQAPVAAANGALHDGATDWEPLTGQFMADRLPEQPNPPTLPAPTDGLGQIRVVLSPTSTATLRFPTGEQTTFAVGTLVNDWRIELITVDAQVRLQVALLVVSSPAGLRAGLVSLHHDDLPIPLLTPHGKAELLYRDADSYRIADVRLSVPQSSPAGDTIDIPDVIGLPQQEAVSQLEALGIDTLVVKQVVSEQAQVGLVIDQDPQPGPGPAAPPRQAPDSLTVTLVVGTAPPDH